MAEITLKGRRIPLLYTTYEMKEIQEKVGPLNEVIDRLMGRNPDDEEDKSKFGGTDQLDTAAKIIMILGNAGLEEGGEAPDLTEKKVLRSLRPTDLADAVIQCADAIADGMRSEMPKKDKEGPVDVTLEEIERKKETTG